MENKKAMRELEIASQTCNTGDALHNAIESIVRKYGASERVVKTWPNGLKKVQILDRDGLLVGEYTRD
jgi:hypothetical protein